MPSVLAFSFALASRSARSLSVLASVASNTALYSAIANATCAPVRQSPYSFGSIRTVVTGCR